MSPPMDLPTPINPATPVLQAAMDVPTWWSSVHEVSEEEQTLGRWARGAMWFGMSVLILASLVLMLGELIGPPANPALDGTPADPSIEQHGHPMMPVERPGLLPSAEPDRVTLNSHVVGTLRRPQDWTMDLMQENHAPTPVDVDVQARFNRVPSTWHRVRIARGTTVIGEPSRDPQPARMQVLVAPGSEVTVLSQNDSTTRLRVPAGRIFWAYTVATPSSTLAPTVAAAGASDPLPTVVLRVGAVPPAAVQAKMRALDHQAIAWLLGATLGVIGVISLAWAGLCRWGQLSLRQDRTLERRPRAPRQA